VTIDWWTLGFQAANVLILIWLLERFFWRPVAAMIAERRATAQKTLADAEGKRAAAVTALADIAKTRAGFVEERDAVLNAAQETAEQAKAVQVREAASEAAALEAAAKAAIARSQDAAEKAWIERASQLAVDIAQRLAARLDGPEVVNTFLNWLLKEIHRLPNATRQAVAVSGTTLEATTASPLAPADQQRYGKLISEAFGTNLPIVFKVDPALIAGIELRGSHLVVTNSWRADLTKILADIAHDNQP
jgi:F-type H+-transporting ATPase subunit b